MRGMRSGAVCFPPGRYSFVWAKLKSRAMGGAAAEEEGGRFAKGVRAEVGTRGGVFFDGGKERRAVRGEFLQGEPVGVAIGVAQLEDVDEAVGDGGGFLGGEDPGGGFAR